MRQAILALGLLTGCDVAFGLERGSDVDARDDVCFGSATALLPTTCVARPHTSVVPAPDLDTDDDAACGAIVNSGSGEELCLIAGTTVAVVNGLVPRGRRPVVLAATETITIAEIAVVDVSGTDAWRAAGSESVSCDHGQDTGESTAAAGAGGGAGGSFASTGTTGGSCNGASIGGSPGDSSVLRTVRGGCGGGNGGMANNGTVARGGSGGGAIYLVAHVAIDVGGIIDASGGGGGAGRLSGAGQNAGAGGGGGSGGLIVFDAPMVILRGSAKLVANGGGGGGGGSVSSTSVPDGNGAAGASADPINGRFPFPAFGGTYGQPGGGGGADGIDRLNEAAPGTGGNGCSGGGGAGGIGVIRAYTSALTNDTASISPRIAVQPPI